MRYSAAGAHGRDAEGEKDRRAVRPRGASPAAGTLQSARHAQKRCQRSRFENEWPASQRKKPIAPDSTRES